MIQKVTLSDIAKVAGVHPSTVSRALDPTRSARVNAQTINRVREVAEELGYRPDVIASGFRGGRTGTVGVVVADLANPWVVPILRGIEHHLERTGLMATIAETRDDLGSFNERVESLMERRVDAIITTEARDDHLPAHREGEGAQLPGYQRGLLPVGRATALEQRYRPDEQRIVGQRTEELRGHDGVEAALHAWARSILPCVN